VHSVRLFRFQRLRNGSGFYPRVTGELAMRLAEILASKDNDAAPARRPSAGHRPEAVDRERP
jgi:hypothetical protein